MAVREPNVVDAEERAPHKEPKESPSQKAGYREDNELVRHALSS
jgi:hypothetical protein